MGKRDWGLQSRGDQTCRLRKRHGSRANRVVRHSAPKQGIERRIGKNGLGVGREPVIPDELVPVDLGCARELSSFEIQPDLQQTREGWSASHSESCR